MANFNKIFQENNCLVKGDISGIQEFIFNVKSQGAAKSLKARSYFIYALSEMALDLIRDTLNNNFHLLYNGGGNFYFFTKDLQDGQLKSLQSAIDHELKFLDIHLSLALATYDSNKETFDQVWTNVNQASAESKQRRFSTLIEAFQPFNLGDQTNQLKRFGRELTLNPGFEILPNGSSGAFFGNDSFFLFDRQFKLSKSLRQFEDHVISKLPRFSQSLNQEYLKVIEKYNEDAESDEVIGWENAVIPFDILARFAEVRTGTHKLGVLKFDLDNLGETLVGISEAEELHRVSQALYRFFSHNICDFWNSSFDQIVLELDDSGNPIEINNKKHLKFGKIKENYSDNIYIIYSGGDDCMLLGGWDAVFEFAFYFHREFESFREKELRAYPNLTLSGGLIMVDAKFPVVRFARLADEALDQAKYGDGSLTGSRKEKNKISFLGERLSWKEFGTTREIAHKIEELIVAKNEPKSIIQRIARSAFGYNTIQQKARNGQILAPQVWKLFYYLRNTKNKEETESIVEDYSRALLDAALARQETNPFIFPLAARWAEFLTRKKE
ncbi:MAG: hypothetical protein KDC85_22840 [Saprospiraceae bacterium]|nr:hypothetical protein [Saprospiraceae bacterium]